MSYPFTPEPESWDRLFLGAFMVPGLVVDSNGATSFEYDVGKTNATDAAFITYKGRKPRELNFKINLTTEEEYNDFKDLLPQLNVDPTSKTVQPFSLGHEQGSLHGVRECFITNIGTPQPNAASGWEVTISVIEFVAKPSTSKASTTPKKKNDDNRSFSQRGLNPEPTVP